MINNDVLRSIRYMLDLSDHKVVEIAHLADPALVIGKDDVRAFLLKDDDPGHLACSDAVLAHVLDGLIVHLRGRDESVPLRPVEKRISNNVVLKKLRVAFELKDVDMHSRCRSRSCRRCSASPGTRISAHAATSCCAISSRG